MSKDDGVTIISGALIPESRDGQYEAVVDKARRVIQGAQDYRCVLFAWPVAEWVRDENPLKYRASEAVDVFEVHLADGTPLENATPYLARWLQALPSTVEYVRAMRLEKEAPGSFWVWPVAPV